MLTFKDLSVEFELIRNGEIFWMNSNPSYGSQSQRTKSATPWFGIKSGCLQISRICRQNGNFEILHIQSEKTLWWNIFENHNQSFQKIFFFGKTGKKWNAVPRHIVAGQKPLNYTIFKALGRKDGSWKQVHLWQVSKASQLQYYLVKILQDNEFFTRLKNARRFLSSALS